jgi:transposase-like protein
MARQIPQNSKALVDNWANLSTYFEYPEAVRRIIYTTNAIEGFNRQLRKVTKSETVFPTDDSLLKMLYLATMDITKNGRVTDRIGVRFIPSWRFSLKKGYLKNQRERY